MPAGVVPETLIQRLEALCTPVRARGDRGAVATTVAAINALLPWGGLARGMVHEWLGMGGEGGGREGGGGGQWSPCMTMLVEMARGVTATPAGGERVVWVGETVWPYPGALKQTEGGAGGEIANEHANEHANLRLERCLFVRAPRAADRLWATDLALRSRAAAAVIADARGFDLAATRRLQLAAEAGGGVCLLARPAWERSVLTAAGTRWMVSWAPSPTMKRRWTVELLRCKGMRPTSRAACAWTLERDDAAGAVRVVADVLDRPREATPGRAAG